MGTVVNAEMFVTAIAVMTIVFIIDVVTPPQIWQNELSLQEILSQLYTPTSPSIC